MLKRKRAWDVMREDYATVTPDVSLGEMLRALGELQQRQPDAHGLVVASESGAFQGLVSIWNILETMEGCLVVDELSGPAGGDWNAALRGACLDCCGKRVEEFMLRDAPLVKPSDALDAVLRTFLTKRKAIAAVEEGGRVIGVIYFLDLYKEISRDILKML